MARAPRLSAEGGPGFVPGRRSARHMTAGSPGPHRGAHPLQSPDLAGSAIPGTGLWGRAMGREAEEGG